MEQETKKASDVRERAKKLSQYKRLVREIRDDRLRLAQLSGQLLRAGRGASRVAGLPDLFGFTNEDLDGYRRYIHENVERCLALVAGLQQYINGIADSEIRRLFIWRYVYGYSWQKVAYAMGWYDESLPRKKHNRYLEAHIDEPFFAEAASCPEKIARMDDALRHEALAKGRHADMTKN